MIHEYDSHYWIARTPDGWISAQDHYSYDPIFLKATKIRIDPISDLSIQAALEAEVPPGYTAFLRTDLHRNLQGDLIRLGYIMAMERGDWPDPGKISIGGFELDDMAQPTAWAGLPIIDGFRAELCTWNGQVAFESSSNFSYSYSFKDRRDLYKFERK
jgi:hypothetical protein